jgi:hypothetical protein
VNKLCCPFCWKFLHRLGSDRRFGVRGQHNKAFPLALPGWITVDLAEKIIEDTRTDILVEIEDMLKQHDLKREQVSKREQERVFRGQHISMDGSEGRRSISSERYGSDGRRSISSEQSDGSLSPSVATKSSVTSGGHLLPNPRPDFGQKPTIGFFKR